ncbi:hypothetical protein [Stenotrophomonas sp. 278]|uniref:hypothetical protein n=1 Tax=Stenotrophomonas sp. 278 TaxID=2479851 RepID=UPI000F68F204|nr:hypothetical protein [Stenotrophomonas sp. 278]RRU17827.1 hypothetical protein EGJ34_06725 [Stenotrophomonas sp. 278]
MSKPTTILPVVLVSIQRSEYHTITDSVPKHEVEILQLIHGEDNVEVLNDDYHAVELPNNATQEYQRLISKYSEKYRPAIDQVFRNGARDIAKETGMELGKDSFRKQSEAVIDSKLPPRPGQKGYEQPATTAQSVQAGGGSQEGEGEEEQEELSHADLRAELTRLGIEHKGNASRDSLQALYDAAQAGAADSTLGE